MSAFDTVQETREGGLGPWLAFTGCLIAVFMQMIDVTIVNTALPNLTADLAASPSQQLLVVSGYSLAFACTLLTAARIGAIFGRRVVFLVSVVAFTALSVWCGMSSSATELVFARIFQGAAGAGMAAQTIAILIASFPPHLHQQVFALYGATAGFAGMLGPIVGGGLVTADIAGLGWHSVFLMNLPIGLLAFALGFRYLRLGKPPERDRLDLGGVALSTVSLFALLAALADIQQNSWRAGPFGVIAAALVLGAAFVAYERRLTRRGGSPLVRLDLFADRGFAIGSWLVASFFGLFTAFVFTVSITLQDELRFSPLRTGMAMTPFALGAGAGALASPFLVKRWGVKVLALGIAVYGGCVALGAGYLWVTNGQVNLLLALGPVFLAGLGVGLFGVQLQPLMLSGLKERQMAEASGQLPTIEQIGNAVGLALLSVVFFRAHTLGGSVLMLSAIAVGAVAMALPTLALPDPAKRLR
ncbi:EmrB/QacA subfamily drug resistance transporter [Nocardia tenerifensis]|uniref:EmrB/QacA subfamily drug resistance transporter n=1 Tax=Nocardia tenerifensis TaxID=228006 RepID=A0A318KGF4_9NOCA|nr:MFS transporter [Nocardia tenerifensis]PXX71342.1 EmrB/QacA subfamily drug resistance transporter [Nocardia tenerifensis]